jgi:hypothetical protein
MKSSQSRIAKIEAGDPSVSLDLIQRAHRKRRNNARYSGGIHDKQTDGGLSTFASGYRDEEARLFGE